MGWGGPCVRVCVCAYMWCEYAHFLALTTPEFAITICHRKQISNEKCIFIAANSLQLRDRQTQRQRQTDTEGQRERERL